MLITYIPVFAFTSDRMYPTQLGVSLHDAKLTWLRVLFTDEASEFGNVYGKPRIFVSLSLTTSAAYHCNIALMQVCNEIFLSDGHSPPNALYYLSRTFAQVTKRLESDNALSDSTIAIVVSLIMQEQLRQQQSAAAVHVKGLEKMIRLRGGLNQLEGNMPLLLKICK